MTWSIELEPAGLVRPDPGPGRPQLEEALADCAESLSPVGTVPSLSTYWIDRVLIALSPAAPAESVIATGNAWSLVRHGDTVAVRFDYAEERVDEGETIPVDELAAGLSAYRDAVVRAIEDGHQLDDRCWVQRNPNEKPVELVADCRAARRFATKILLTAGSTVLRPTAS